MAENSKIEWTDHTSGETMTDEAKKRIAAIGYAIQEINHDTKRLKRELAKAEVEIEKLDAERWQLFLTP